MMKQEKKWSEECSSVVEYLTQDAQGPEFDPQYNQKKSREKHKHMLGNRDIKDDRHLLKNHSDNIFKTFICKLTYLTRGD